LESDTNSDADTIYTPEEIPEDIPEDIPEEISEDIPEDILVDNITIYYNTGDIYILGSDTESEGEL
jgi:hypothetical protein